MTAIQVPEHRQNALVREQHLTRRFDPDCRGLLQKGAEFLAHHPLPRIELENGAKRPIVRPDECGAVPADLVYGKDGPVKSGLARSVVKIRDRCSVLNVVDGAEINRSPAALQPLVLESECQTAPRRSCRASFFTIVTPVRFNPKWIDGRYSCKASHLRIRADGGFAALGTGLSRFGQTAR